MKKINVLKSFTLMVMLLSLSLPVHAVVYANEGAASNIQLQVNRSTMTVDGQTVVIDDDGTTPIILDGTTILPVRAVVEAMGGTVNWDGASRSIILNHGENEIKLTIDSPIASLNGIEQTLDVSPTIINGKTMLPIRFIAESFGFQVSWEATTSVVTIVRNVANETVGNIANEVTNEIPNEIANASEQKILIAYFTNPEPDGVDAVARASRVVVNGEVVGNVQFIAQAIQRETGGNLFAIETVEPYPARPELMEIGQNQKNQNARPALKTQIANVDEYDVIFLGYPNWNADMPMALYTFLEGYDFSGKTIIPFCPHGGSGFSSTINTVASLQPNATVITDGFSVSRDNAPNSEADIISWLRGLNIGG